MASPVSGSNSHKITLADLQLKPTVQKTETSTVSTPAKEKEVTLEKETKDTSEIKTKNPKYDFLMNLSFVNDKAEVQPTKVASVTATPATSTTSKNERPKNIDNKAGFHNTDLATADDINKILKRYNSPHQGKGQVILDTCKQYGVNPIMMLAIMQQESQFGSKKLKPENQANPFSVHFNHDGKGIAKLRYPPTKDFPNGKMPNFEESLKGGIETVLN